ncbi:MAG: hypothetical protein H3C47_09940 [Candidatus Cloacimonetes bacterium]|nr:hypothetical protein [Candidatus Cloacimonadota bacterium]
MFHKVTEEIDISRNDPLTLDGELEDEKQFNFITLLMYFVSGAFAWLEDKLFPETGNEAINGTFLFFLAIAVFLTIARASVNYYIELHFSKNQIKKIRAIFFHYFQETDIATIDQIKCLEMKRTLCHNKHTTWYEWEMAMRMSTDQIYCIGPSVNTHNLIREYKKLQALANRLNLEILPVLDSKGIERQDLQALEEAVSTDLMRFINNEVQWARILVPIGLALVLFIPFMLMLYSLR